ncbi:hypothetical protein QYH69_30015 [Paraburkholderia sp. SARCC-3016]|jgi:hypothetical protein|uniref:hypothetical protein n=1 Tax=Paraburkholderia sp. SARCC-3016 TaxID=3058611 RepID=UPI002806B4A8|nr:hypothetical protein [Paraburkholderia sp. SARCC-3016]MDQ7981466.1 hypothetical protein [Paraburkholderia sp. SARCC-3016]
MKPLLRAVLIIDALLLLAFGLLFLASPWKSLYDALHLVQTDPVLVGQGFGLALIGLAWLALHASLDGALTATVAKVIGHVNWLTALLMLVWLIGLHTPPLTGFGQLVAVVVAIVLLVVGLGGVRLARAVRRRERAIAAEVVAAERADKAAARQAAKDAKQEARVEAKAQAAARATPAAGGYAATEPVIEPVLSPRQATVIDPATGRTIDPATGRAVDPVSGRPLEPARGSALDSDAAAVPASQRGPATDAEAHAEAAREAREEARRDAAGSPGSPRPPFHG